MNKSTNPILFKKAWGIVFSYLSHYRKEVVLLIVLGVISAIANGAVPYLVGLFFDAVIAQSFNKKSFIIFGATHPKYLHLSKKAITIYDKDRHKLCFHTSREEEIKCCEEFCMDRIRVSDIFTTIKVNT